MATMGLSRTVSEINVDFSRKIAIFSHPWLFDVPAEGGSPRSWVLAVGVKKNRIMALPGRERNLKIFSSIWIQYTNVTDGQTPADSKDRAYA